MSEQTEATAAPAPEAPGEALRLVVAGHELRMTVDEAERRYIESAAKDVSNLYRRLSQKSVSSSPAKVCAMVALHFAYEAASANEIADEAEQYSRGIQQYKQASARLERLLARMDAVMEGKTVVAPGLRTPVAALNGASAPAEAVAAG